MGTFSLLGCETNTLYSFIALLLWLIAAILFIIYVLARLYFEFRKYKFYRKYVAKFESESLKEKKNRV